MSDELDTITKAQTELLQLAIHAKLLQEMDKPENEKVDGVLHVMKLAVQAGIFTGE